MCDVYMTPVSIYQHSIYLWVRHTEVYASIYFITENINSIAVVIQSLLTSVMV